MLFEKGRETTLYWITRSDGIPTVPTNLAVQLSGDGSAFAGATNMPASCGDGQCKLVVTAEEANVDHLAIKVTADNSDTDVIEFWFEMNYLQAIADIFPVYALRP